VAAGMRIGLAFAKSIWAPSPHFSKGVGASGC
jgi:hypothetical protein